jgi:hypothetical protein
MAGPPRAHAPQQACKCRPFTTTAVAAAGIGRGLYSWGCPRRPANWGLVAPPHPQHLAPRPHTQTAPPPPPPPGPRGRASPLPAHQSTRSLGPRRWPGMRLRMGFRNTGVASVRSATGPTRAVRAWNSGDWRRAGGVGGPGCGLDERGRAAQGASARRGVGAGRAQAGPAFRLPRVPAGAAAWGPTSARAAHHALGRARQQLAVGPQQHEGAGARQRERPRGEAFMMGGGEG